MWLVIKLHLVSHCFSSLNYWNVRRILNLEHSESKKSFLLTFNITTIEIHIDSVFSSLLWYKWYSIHGSSKRLHSVWKRTSTWHNVHTYISQTSCTRGINCEVKRLSWCSPLSASQLQLQDKKSLMNTVYERTGVNSKNKYTAQLYRLLILNHSLFSLKCYSPCKRNNRYSCESLIIPIWILALIRISLFSGLIIFTFLINMLCIFSCTFQLFNSTVSACTHVDTKHGVIHCRWYI